MGSRRKGREMALQALYLSDVGHISVEQALKSVLYGTNPEQPIIDFAKKISQGTDKNRVELDAIIKKYAQNWEMNRMAALDRNLMRLSAYELLFDQETPISVVIDEAVEIAKSFSTEESGKFVNGILDKIKNERKTGPGS
jgi:transcription antitermination protein NusB